MSGINNYIHYNRDYYLHFGLQAKEGRRIEQGTWGEKPIDILQSTHNSIISHQKNLGNWTKANSLARQLNYYQSGRKGEKVLSGSQLTEEEYKLLEKYAWEYLKTQVSRTDNLEAKFNNLRFDYADGLDPSELAGGKGEYLNEDAKYIRAKTIKDRIERLNRVYDSTSDSNIQTKIKELKILEDQLTKEIENAKSKVYYLQDSIGKDGQILHKANINAQTFVEKYNELMKTQVFTQAISNGHLAEFMTMGILFMLQNKGNEITDKMMKNFTENLTKEKSNGYSITGKDATQKGLFQANYAVNIGNKYNFANDLNKNNKFLNYEVNGSSGLLSVKASQDKVDAVITMEGEEELRLSIKNYQSGLHSNISLHSGNFLRLIQGEDNFINHYLNIATTRTGGKKELKKEWVHENGKKVEEQAKELMKNYTFYKAVAGGVRTTELNKYTLEANYLVFNDSTEGHFYVVPISAIPDLTKDDNKGISVKYNGKNVLTLNNEWMVNSREDSGNKRINSYQKAYSRMRKMMLDLASMSVNVHLAINQIKNLSKFH